MALFNKDSKRTATAVAFQNTTLYQIPGLEFERLLREHPSISFKILGAMSKRLRDVIEPSSDSVAGGSGKLGKVLTICSPRAGYGKSTVAVTMAQIIAHELPRRVLFMDLDLAYGDGSFMMGVYSTRSIVNLAASLGDDAGAGEIIEKFSTKLLPNLSILAAPKDMIDAERLLPEDLIKIINVCRRHFDYLIIDTNSSISDHLLNALDMADKILFLVDLGNSVAIKSNSLFFQAINSLSLPEGHVHVTFSHTHQGGRTDHPGKSTKWPINGQIPFVEGTKLEPAALPYATQPDGEYCQTVRILIKNILREYAIRVPMNTGFLSRWFSTDTPAVQGCMAEEKTAEGVMSCNKLGFSAKSFEPQLKEVHGLMAKGFLVEAQEKCSEVLDISPGSPTILQVLGEIFLQKGDIAHALEVFSKVHELDPGNYTSVMYLGHLKGDESLKASALQLLATLIDKNPEFPDLLNDQGKMLLLFGNPREARGFFERALVINPAYAEVQMNIALSYGDEGRDEDAIDQLLKIDAKTVKVYYLLGQHFFNIRRFFDAQTAFTRVAEINPHFLETDERLASLRDFFAKLQSLVEMHKHLIRESPGYPDIHVQLGNLYYTAGKSREAEVEFQEALRLKPTYIEAQSRLDEVRKEGPRSRTRVLEASAGVTTMQASETGKEKPPGKELNID